MPCGQTQSMVWCGMMAQYKDVGPGSGPSLVALFEGGLDGERTARLRM